MRRALIKLFFIALGALIIATNLMPRDEDNLYLVTDLQGHAQVRFSVERDMGTDESGQPQSYRQTSPWVALQRGMRTGPGDIIRTASQSRVDLMPESGVGIRIQPRSLIKVDKKQTTYPFMEVAVNTGKVLLRVVNSQLQGYQRGTEVLRVRTPVATVGIRGTTFSVDYDAATRQTAVAVHEGKVNVRQARELTGGVDVATGQETQVSSATVTPQVVSMTPENARQLQEAEHLKVERTTAERLLEGLDMKNNTFGPLYNRLVSMIAEYEMHVFAKAIISMSPLRWDGGVPSRLQQVELQEGDYNDPWDRPYHYERLTRKRAVIISAGPDGILNTRDDLFVKVEL